MPTKASIRVIIVQWEMKPFAHTDALLAELEAIFRILAPLKPDFVLFSEFFSCCLDTLKSRSTPEAFRALSLEANAMRTAGQHFAVQYQTNIILGSIPTPHADKTLNTSYLCHQDGRVESYHKLHLTPFEVGGGLSKGSTLPIFDTDCGRIGIQICYDIEFPEASRMLALQGAQIIFVPYQTDFKAGHQRVSYCAQARAIENECYVVTAGNVGILRNHPLMDLNYAQSAVYTPSDHGFPDNAILRQAALNVPDLCMADLDMKALEQIKTQGSVHLLADRRPDVYAPVYAQTFAQSVTVL